MSLQKRCRCCRVYWPSECYAVARHRVDGTPILRATCEACRKGCKQFAQRYYQRNREACIERTRTWKAALRADVMTMTDAR